MACASHEGERYWRTENLARVSAELILRLYLQRPPRTKHHIRRGFWRHFGLRGAPVLDFANSKKNEHRYFRFETENYALRQVFTFTSASTRRGRS